jgi:hypothetical protein
VGIKNVLSYFDRKRIAIEDVLSSEAATLPDLVCETPVMSPKSMLQRTMRSPPTPPDAGLVSMRQSHMMSTRLQRLESPDPFKTAELLFSDIWEYVLAAFGTGCWISHGPDKYCQSKRTSFAEGGPHDLYRQIQNACSLFDDKRPAEGVRTLSKGFANIKIIVEDQSLGALPYLIRSITLLLVRQLKPIVLILCKQLCSMAAVIGSGEDRVTHFFKSIFSRISLLAHDNEANDCLLAAYEVP